MFQNLKENLYVLNAGRVNGMSDYYYIAFVFLIGVIAGIILCCLIEWVTENYQPKAKKKAKTAQPVIEVYEKDYKKKNTSPNVFNKTI